MLAISDLTVGYGKIIALDNLSLSLEKGALTTLIGANGAGKSTLLKTISGLMAPISGSIKFNDKEIAGLEPHKIISMALRIVLKDAGYCPGRPYMKT